MSAYVCFTCVGQSVVYMRWAANPYKNQILVYVYILCCLLRIALFEKLVIWPYLPAIYVIFNDLLTI